MFSLYIFKGFKQIWFVFDFFYLYMNLINLIFIHIMKNISRKRFLYQIGMLGSSFFILGGCDFQGRNGSKEIVNGINIGKTLEGEDIFTYIKRVYGKMDITKYRQILGAANEFKEGDLTIGVAAGDEKSRKKARELLSQTKIGDLNKQTIFQDGIQELIQKTTKPNQPLQEWTMAKLKSFVLNESEESIKEIMPCLSSDIIACLVKLLSNNELISVGQKVFNPLPNSKIGSKGYLSARIQPNSPTDNVDDISWQVFDAWSYGVGDLVLGTNPVSSEPDSIEKIEKALYNIIQTFNLEAIIPNSVLSHIDIQSQVEEMQPGTTGIWFQSLGGTVSANQTFDITIDKMFRHAAKRTGKYGLYAETGQGADSTNGHGEGFDMVIHEARKYGFMRSLKLKMSETKTPQTAPWAFLNDVAGFIGPEVFKSKEQLVRCCLEDTVMGKLHGLTIGLDICSTLHMDVTLDDLDWCIEQVMPANPAYLMALPTKNDPMLGYLTTAFGDHVKIREKFGYKVNDDMWAFFKKLEVIDKNDKPGPHFGDPVWVYYKYCKAKNDSRNQDEIYEEGKKLLTEIRERGVPIAEGYGKNIWNLDPPLEMEIRKLYEDAKISIWTEWDDTFISSIPIAKSVITRSTDRKDYVYHPISGEQLSPSSIKNLENLRLDWDNEVPDVQILISDGLNARALMDEGHLIPYLNMLVESLKKKNYKVSRENIVITNGRVRAGYQCGEVLFGKPYNSSQKKGIIHIIGERPGSEHHTFSAYLSAATVSVWNKKGMVDHDISRVVSGISDTSLKPEKAVEETIRIFDGLFKEKSII